MICPIPVCQRRTSRLLLVPSRTDAAAQSPGRSLYFLGNCVGLMPNEVRRELGAKNGRRPGPGVSVCRYFSSEVEGAPTRGNPRPGKQRRIRHRN
jgi:hypothetical protein